MADGNKGKEYFLYSYNNTARVFPIDYTISNLADRADKDPRMIKNKILEPSIFREELQGLMISEEAKEKAKGLIDKNKCPIPLEAGLFFAELVKQLEKKDVLELDEESIKNFFQELSQKILEDDDTLEKKFYRHILMEEQYFTEPVMSTLWESELNDRVERLKKCIKGAQADIQAKVMVDCFTALDKGAFELAFTAMPEETAGASTLSKPWKPLQEALKKLLSKRNGMKIPSNNIHASYRVENVLVDGLTMEDVFIKLNKPAERKKLLKPAREAYWESILKGFKIPPFEERYRSARKYLAESAGIVDEAELRQIIKVQCKFNCRQCSSEWFGVPLPETPSQAVENKYLSQFISVAILEGFELGYAKYCDKISKNNEISKGIRDKINSMPPYTMPLLSACNKKHNYRLVPSLREMIYLFKDYFRSIFEFLNSRNFLAVKIDDPFCNLNTTVEEFMRIINDAVRFLELENSSEFLYTTEYVEKALELHEKGTSSNDSLLLYDCIANYECPILNGISLIILHLISEEVEEKLIKVLPMFIKIRKTEGENN